MLWMLQLKRPLVCCSEMSKVQDDEVGDGTTSVAVLASELLKVISALANMKSTLRSVSLLTRHFPVSSHHVNILCLLL